MGSRLVSGSFATTDSPPVFHSFTQMPTLHCSGSFAVVKKGIRKRDGAAFAVKFIDKTALKKDDEAMLVSFVQSCVVS